MPSISAEAVAAYFRDNPNATQKDAGKHFGCSDRTVRNYLKPPAHPSDRPQRRYQARRVAAPSTPPRRLSPIYPPLANDIAGDKTYWRCPVTGELLPVIPGMRRHTWEAGRRAIFGRKEETEAEDAPACEVEPEAEGTAQAAARTAESANAGGKMPQYMLAEKRHVEHPSAYAFTRTAPPRVVPRVPVAPRRGGFVDWLRAHPVAAMQLLAVVVTALLILEAFPR